MLFQFGIWIIVLLQFIDGRRHHLVVRVSNLSIHFLLETFDFYKKKKKSKEISYLDLVNASICIMMIT